MFYSATNTFRCLLALTFCTVLGGLIGCTSPTSPDNHNTTTSNTIPKTTTTTTPRSATDNSTKNAGATKKAPTNPQSEEAAERALRFHGKQIILTKHAHCRMECRHITASEIDEVLKGEHVNLRKSGQSHEEANCPTKAYEGVTHNGQTVRVVVAECADKAKLLR